MANCGELASALRTLFRVGTSKAIVDATLSTGGGAHIHKGTRARITAFMQMPLLHDGQADRV